MGSLFVPKQEIFQLTAKSIVTETEVKPTGSPRFPHRNTWDDSSRMCQQSTAESTKVKHGFIKRKQTGTQRLRSTRKTQQKPP